MIMFVIDDINDTLSFGLDTGTQDMAIDKSYLKEKNLFLSVHLFRI